MAVGISGSFASLPGNRTFVELVKDVLLYVGQPQDDDSIDQAKKAVAAGIRTLNAQEWQWSLTYDDLTTAAAFDYALPRDVKKPKHLELLDTSSNPVGYIEYKDPVSFLKENFRADAPGTPRAYSILNYHSDGILSLDITPSSSFITTYPTMRFWYARKVLVPSSNSEKVDCPSEIEHYLELYGREHMAAHLKPQMLRSAREDRVFAWRQLLVDDNEYGDFADHG